MLPMFEIHPPARLGQWPTQEKLFEREPPNFGLAANSLHESKVPKVPQVIEAVA